MQPADQEGASHERHDLFDQRAVVTLRGARGFSMMEMVYVGEVGLIGEVIGITSEKTTIQVYEDRWPESGRTRAARARRCAPHWALALCRIFLTASSARWPPSHKNTALLLPAACMASLDEHKLWDVTVLVKPGQQVTGAALLPVPGNQHHHAQSMVPPDVSGRLPGRQKTGSTPFRTPSAR